jgi:hypothetical protein
MRLLPILVALCLAHGTALAACPPEGSTGAQLTQLRAAKWDVADHSARQKMALAMLACLADPDPVLRDEFAFEALQTWMRAQKLDGATLQQLRATLLARLKTAEPTGFAQPFAALVLAEVARADRVKPYLSDAERKELVQAGAAYLSTLRDYRGFDEKSGWRHGVAHAADLMLQLSVNPAIARAQQQAMLAAIAAQLGAAGAQAHFFQYGEGERLMAPLFYLARRSELEAADWETWFGALAPAAGQRPVTQAALAYRHNIKALLLPLYVSLAESADSAQRARVLPFVTKALKQLD